MRIGEINLIIGGIQFQMAELNQIRENQERNSQNAARVDFSNRRKSSEEDKSWYYRDRFYRANSH